MTRMMKTLLAAVATAGSMGAATTAGAAVTINIAQVGTEVVATTSGTLDLTGLTTNRTFPYSGGIVGVSGYVSTGGGSGTVAAYAGMTGASTMFGSGGFFGAASGTGAQFGVNLSAFGNPLVFVSTSYVAGTSLAGTSTFRNATLASLGLTAGTYTIGSLADTVTVNIGQTVGAVPEPATWAMMMLGFAMIGGLVRYRRRGMQVRYA